MSIPAETPAAVTTSPSSTKRASPRTSTSRPDAAKRSRAPHQVVAGRPSRRPAAAKTVEPVQTLVMSVPRAASPRNRSSVAGSSASRRVPWPPGYTSTSKAGAVSQL